MKIDPDAPAYPSWQTVEDEDGPRTVCLHPGIDIRTEFIKAFIAKQIAYEGMEGMDINLVIGCAMEIADATIEAINKD